MKMIDLRLAAIAVRFRLRGFVARRPALFRWVYRRTARMRKNLVGPHTALVIEGFPRSANTFAVLAFQLANPGLRTANHIHSQAQILLAVRMGVPALALIREPEEALRSFLVRRPEIPARAAIDAYREFYEDLLPFRNRIVVATSEQVTSDFGAVVDRVNRTYGTTFARFQSTPERVAAIFAEIDRQALKFKGTLDAPMLNRPHPARQALKQRVDLRGCEAALEAARRVHAAMVAAP